MPYADVETGELFEGCPHCEQARAEAEAQVLAMERERRSDRIARGKAEKVADRAEVARRDGKVWKEILAYWEQAFPDKRISSKGIKSARATKLFQRLEAGTTSEDVRYAIDAAKVWRWVVYGKRQRNGSQSDLAIDLQDVVSVGNDAQFDRLVELGREMVKEKPAW